MIQPTVEQLRAAFKRSGLWRLGWTFERAIGVQHVRKSLTASVDAEQRKCAVQAGTRLPDQLNLGLPSCT